MTRLQAERMLRAAGMGEVAIKETIRTVSEAAYTAQHAAQQGPGEYGWRDARAARAFDRAFRVGIEHVLAQAR